MCSEKESVSGKFISKMQPAQVSQAVDIELEDIEALVTETGDATDGACTTLASLPGTTN